MDTASDLPPSCSVDASAKVTGDSSTVDKLALSPSERTDGVSELSSLASMHIDGSDNGGLDDCVEHDITERVGCINDADREQGSSHKLTDNPDSSQQNGKIPNRDSGIDSPSCATEGEAFPNEDAIDEEDHYDSVTETESVSCCVTLDNKRDSTQDEDSDLDEGSSGEVPDSQPGYLTDTHSDTHKVSTMHAYLLQKFLINPIQSFHLCSLFNFPVLRSFLWIFQQVKNFISDTQTAFYVTEKNSLCLLLSRLE